MSIRFALLTLLPAALALSAGGGPPSDPPDDDRPGRRQPPRPLTDHHVHILGPDAVRDWKALGVTFSRPDSIYTSAASLLRDRGDSVALAVLVPMAHLYGNPEFVGGLAIGPGEVRRRVRRENSHVAREAAVYPNRAVALCSVPVLAPWALEELAYCRDRLRVAGIKIHVASSGVDLRRDAHLARLTAIARFADNSRLPILLHVDPQQRGHDSTHIRRLAERMFGPRPSLSVVIAHLGGSGGYGPWTQTVFRTLRRWRSAAEHSGPRRHVYFELSAVALERESEGVPAMTPEEATRLTADLAAMGFDRILFGSDYPVFDPIRGREALQTKLGLTPEQIEAITAPSQLVFPVRPPRPLPPGARRP